MRPHKRAGRTARPILYELTMALTLDLTTGSTRAAPAARSTAPEKPPLIGLTRAELAEALVAASIVPERQAKMRAQQLWHWLYVRGVSDFSEMFNISKDLRAELAKNFSIARPEIVGSRFRPTVRANGCSAFRRAAPAAPSRSKPSTSPRKAAARSASPARSAAR
jgi:hypothetical protein